MTRPLTTLIVDDEPLAVRRLEIALADILDLRIVGVARDGESALAMIKDARPDLVFLDIKMPGLSGLDVVGALDRTYAPAIIFVTAFGRFAPDAFDVAAVDYLLKPIEFERLGEAVERARRRLHSKDAEARIAELQTVIASLRAETAEASGGQRFETELWISERGGVVRLPVDQVDWFEAERDYVRVHTGGRSYLLRDSVRSLADRLDPDAFLRVHRSALVRTANIARIQRKPGGGARIVLKTGVAVPVGRTYGHALKRLSRAAQGSQPLRVELH